VLANLDDSLTKDVLLAAGWADVDPPWEALFDLWLDPSEGDNRIDDPSLATVVDDLRGRLHDWMVRTEDPLLDGPVPPAEGTVVNTVDQVSASDPTTPPTAHSLTNSRRARNAAETADAED
jgi:N-sulfoglucosamine sulfohydrolase